jgi:xylan 1,4-beta-xylosidase
MIQHEFRYTNPITHGSEMSLRDHQILKVGDRWYMTGTSQPIWKGPNPGVKLFSSPDLLHWSFEGLLVDAATLPDDCFFKGRFWAPEIHAAHGRFYLTVNSGNDGDYGEQYKHRHGVVLFVADRVTGPYTLVTASDSLGQGFKNDASLFTDPDDGRSYLYCSGGGLWQSEINLQMGQIASGDDFDNICSPRDPGLPDWMYGGIEGPFVIKRDGIYYLFFSAWTRGYEIGILRADTPLGPWTLLSDLPVFGTRKRRFRQQQMAEGGYAHVTFEDTDDPFVETGHGAIFEGPDGKDWLCCHYFLEGTTIVGDGVLIEYAETSPQLGIEPLHFHDGSFFIHGPTWTEQVVLW